MLMENLHAKIINAFQIVNTAILPTNVGTIRTKLTVVSFVRVLFLFIFEIEKTNEHQYRLIFIG